MNFLDDACLACFQKKKVPVDVFTVCSVILWGLLMQIKLGHASWVQLG